MGAADAVEPVYRRSGPVAQYGPVIPEARRHPADREAIVAVPEPKYAREDLDQVTGLKGALAVGECEAGGIQRVLLDEASLCRCKREYGGR